ncbi:uncharacterized protein LOC131630167 [Vicia villosa]|uniref:uncharacterized protein LOC131630167 n=1 Tax=Vicia villosa TaxID=3911 RepID=UPI00273CF0FF|nr:uncharacterized protein LOC131630167 [Vicia villosa]
MSLALITLVIILPLTIRYLKQGILLCNRHQGLKLQCQHFCSVIYRFAGEDVNDILRAARQVTNASSSPDQRNSPSPSTNEDQREKGVKTHFGPSQKLQNPN